MKISKNKGSGLRFTIEVEEAGDYFITSRYAYGEKLRVNMTVILRLLYQRGGL